MQRWLPSLLRIKRALFAGVLAPLLIVPPFAPAGAFLPSLALACGLGLLGALLYALACEVLRVLPRRLQLFLVGVLGGIVGCLGIARPLGALAKLQGEHQVLALVCLCGCVAAGAVAAALVWWSRPRCRGVHPARRTSGRVRLAIIAAFGSLALALATFEATHAWLVSYPALQHGLLIGSWLAAFSAALWAIGARSFSREFRAALVLALAGLPFAFGAILWRVNPEAVASMAKAEHTEHWVWLGRTLTDWDGDGSSDLLGGGDCAPFDPQVSPRQREVRGNGLDDNCRHGDAPALPTLPPAAATPRVTLEGRTRPPNLVLVTIDALRADRTTPYGYARNTTPALHEFEQGAVVFENAYTSGAWTCLALPSLFGGIYPRRIEWSPAALTNHLRLLAFPWRSNLSAGESFAISLTVPKAPPTWWLPLALQQQGYRTLALPSRAIAHMTHLLERGWDQVAVPDFELDAALTDLALERVLAEREQPFFLWVHYFGPHEPQTVHPEAPVFGSTLEDKYDHEVAATDYALGRLLRGLDALPEARTAWIVTADHGEAFEGDTQFHGTDLFEGGIRVPLLLRAPGIEVGRVATPASLVDVAPTLLALAGTEAPPGLDGQDLRTLRDDRTVITDLLRAGAEGEVILDQSAVTNTTQRLVRDHLKQVELLVQAHDRARPPHELDAALTPSELSEALARYEESALGL